MAKTKKKKSKSTIVLCSNFNKSLMFSLNLFFVFGIIRFHNLQSLNVKNRHPENRKEKNHNRFIF